MEDMYITHIQTNLNVLKRQTTIHSLFLSFLEAKGIIGQTEVDLLNSINNRFDKSKKFYELILTKSNSYNVLCDALKETKQSGAYKTLASQIPIRFDVRQPVHLFTGREDELAKLHENLTLRNKAATLITQAASVTGLGGIGKTELCRMYIQKYSNEYDDNVIWIPAEKQSNMETAFKILAKDHLNISLKDADGDEKNIKTVVDQVYTFFQEKKCLFVFDNAMTTNSSELDTFLPKRMEKAPFILITSRDKDWELPMNVLVLDELKLNEAIAFVKKGLGIPINNVTQDDIITELVGRLQCFPLSLQQAISFIRQQRGANSTFQIQEYIESFEAETKLLLNYELSLFLSNKYAKTTFTTWKITIDVISTDKDSGKLALNLLNMMSYFEPDKIPVNLFEQGNHDDNVDEDEIHSALQLLGKYSMVNSYPTESTYLLSIHRLVQEVTRIELRCKKGQEENTLRYCLRLFKENTIDENTVTHAISAYKFVDEYAVLVVESSHLPSNILKKLNELKRLNEAELFGFKSFHTLLKYLPEDNIDVAKTQFQLATVKLDQYNYNESGSMMVEVLKKLMAQENHDELKSEIGNVKQGIAKALLFAGKTKEAIPAFTEAYQNRKENDLNELSSSKINSDFIGAATNCLLEIGEYEYCLSHWKKHLDLYEGKMGDVERKIVPFILIQIAIVYEKSGDKVKCVDVAMEAYKKAEIWFDTDVKMAGVGYEVARILANLDKIQDAIEVSTRVFECRIKALGPEDLDTLFSQTQLGDFKRRGDLTKEAIPILQDAHNRLSKKVGAKHMMTLETKMDLAMAKSVEGELEEAIEMAGEVLASFWGIYGPYSDIVLNTIARIVAILIPMGAYGDALLLNSELERIIIEKFGSSDNRLPKLREVIAKLNEQNCSERLETGKAAELLKNIYWRLRIAFPDFNKFKSEQARLDTFSLPPGWSKLFIKPEDCAKVGFFFLQIDDRVQCAFCRGMLSNWEQGDDPRKEHESKFPQCPFISGEDVGNIELETGQL